MKFGAVLRDSAADLPDTEDLFIKYKQLKKSIKRMQNTQLAAAHPAHDDSDSDDDNANDAGPSTKRAKLNEPTPASPIEKEKETDAAVLLDPELEAEFLRVITDDVIELNDRYIEKEEDNVIKFSQLEDAAETVTAPESRAALYRAFVDLHGELLMLFHWSVLAYTGLVKILKKHRKRTGAPLHAPHLENLLSQPFCSVEVTCDMVRKAEEWVSRLAKDLNVAPPPAVPLPEGLLGKAAGGENTNTTTASGGADAVGIVNSTSGNNISSKTEAVTTTDEEKAKVLEAVAAAVAVAAAAEKEAAAAANGGDGTGTPPLPNNAADNTAAEENQEELKKSPKAVAVAATAAAQENLALRRIRAALNVWQQLHSNVSTPSTMIAPGVTAAGAVGVAPQPASLTTSSIA